MSTGKKGKDVNNAESQSVITPSYDILSQPRMNPGAAATTLSSLSSGSATTGSESFGIGDLVGKWREVKCGDGSTALVLKNPEDAFALYGNEWSAKFDVVVKLLNDQNVEVNSEAGKKIKSLCDSLNYINISLMEMYKNSYLTFAARPCLESSMMEKRKMDKAVAAIGLALVSIKAMLDAGGQDSLDKVGIEITKLVDKLTTFMLS